MSMSLGRSRHLNLGWLGSKPRYHEMYADLNNKEDDMTFRTSNNVLFKVSSARLAETW